VKIAFKEMIDRKPAEVTTDQKEGLAQRIS
jgi:hypothetical protein